MDNLRRLSFKTFLWCFFIAYNEKIAEIDKTLQNLHAYDAGARAKFNDLIQWLRQIIGEETKYGYHNKIQFLSAAVDFCPLESSTVFTTPGPAKGNFLMKGVPRSDEYLKPLGDSIQKILISNITNIYYVSNHQRSLLNLYPKNGRVGIPKPVVKASGRFVMPKKNLSFLSESSFSGTPLNVDAHETHVRSSKLNFQLQQESQ